MPFNVVFSEIKITILLFFCSQTCFFCPPVWGEPNRWLSSPHDVDLAPDLAVEEDVKDEKPDSLESVHGKEEEHQRLCGNLTPKT